MIRTGSVLLALGVIVMAAAGAALLVPGVRADPPDDLVVLLDNCDNFSRMNAEIVAYPTHASRSYAMLLNATSSWFTVDALWGSHPRYSWSDDVFREHHVPLASPEEAKSFPVFVLQDLWGDCLNGFDGTLWTQQSPYADGYDHEFAALHWYKGALPHPWAGDVDIYLGIASKKQMLKEIVWHFEGAPEWGRVSVMKMKWDAQSGPGFNRLAPYPWPKMPSDLANIR